MPLFYGRNEREDQKDRDFRMPPNSLGVPVFFWRSRAMQPSDRVFDRDFSTPSSTDSASVQDQRLGSSLVFDTIFTIFCSGLWWETYESVVLCNFFERPGCVLNLPHRWLCVEQWLLPPTYTDGGRRRESGQWRPSKRLERNFWFLMKHGISCVSIRFGRTHICVSVFTCCHAITHWCLIMGKRPLNVAKRKSKQWGGRRGAR